MRLRHALGLASQRALAQRTRNVDPDGAGVSQRLIWDAENGKPVSPRAQVLIATALGVTPAALLRLNATQRALHALGPTGVSILGLAAVAAIVAVILWRVQLASDPEAIPQAVRADRERPSVSIGAVQFTGSEGDYEMVILGSGFGTGPFAGTLYGEVPYFRIFDDTVHFEAGYSTDSMPLSYLQWTDRRIVISGLPAMPGDSVVVNVWNPTTRVGAAWGGNVGPVPADAPRIISVSFSGKEIRIRGSGLGPPPERVPFASNAGYVTICDGAYHRWGTGRSVAFMIGNIFSATKIAFTHWSPTLVVISGFVGQAPPGGMSISLGDPLTVEIWNPRIVSGVHRTAWGGTALDSPLSGRPIRVKDGP